MPPALRASTLLLLIAGWPVRAGAQELRGTLRAEDRPLPVAGARLYLASASGALVDTTFSASDGGFRLSAPGAGEYVVHFQMDAYAHVSSDPLRLAVGEVTEFDFTVPLVSTAAMRRMGETIRTDPRLQSSLPEICGEPLRLWEAGLLVGTVRVRANQHPVPRARVAVVRDGESVRSTLSSDRGIFVLCNVPVGAEVEVVTEAPGGAPETTLVEIRPGMVSWYDLFVGPGRR